MTRGGSRSEWNDFRLFSFSIARRQTFAVPMTANKTVFWLETASPRESCPRLFGKGIRTFRLPEYHPRGCPINHLFSYTLLDGSKEGEISPQRTEFCSRNFVLLFLNRDILNQVCGLTLQQGTEGIKDFPRHQLPVADLL